MKTQDTMTAILFIGWHEASEVPTLRKLRAMLPLVDKPMLQVATEALVRLGCAKFHVFLDDDPEAVRQFLGNGERWGIKVTYHYRDEEMPLSGNLKRLALDPEQLCWLASAECMPGELVHPGAARDVAPDTAFCWQAGDQSRWSGWGLFRAQTLASLGNDDSHGTLAAALTDAAPVARHAVAPPLDLSSDERYLDSSIRRLQAFSADAGKAITIARGARIHPQARISGPAYIGPDARIEADAVIGPNAVIGHDAVVDQGAEIRDSVVLPETYVGGGLFLEEAVVAPGALASIKNSTLLNQVEPHLLASSRTRGEKRNLPLQLGMGLLRAALFPLYALGRAILKQSGLNFRSVTTLRIFQPAAHGQAPEIIAVPIANTAEHSPLHGNGGWLAHFVHTFYPGLQAVANQQIGLFGLELRDAGDVARLPEHWQALYHAHRCGLLNESMLQAAALADPALRHAADACAVAGLPRRTQWRVIGHYCINVISDFGRLLRSTGISKQKPEFSSHP